MKYQVRITNIHTGDSVTSRNLNSRLEAEEYIQYERRNDVTYGEADEYDYDNIEVAA